MTDLTESQWHKFGIKAENPNFAIPTGGPKITVTSLTLLAIFNCSSSVGASIVRANSFTTFSFRLLISSQASSGIPEIRTFCSSSLFSICFYSVFQVLIFLFQSAQPIIESNILHFEAPLFHGVFPQLSVFCQLMFIMFPVLV